MNQIISRLVCLELGVRAMKRYSTLTSYLELGSHYHIHFSVFPLTELGQKKVIRLITCKKRIYFSTYTFEFEKNYQYHT